MWLRDRVSVRATVPGRVLLLPTWSVFFRASLALVALLGVSREAAARPRLSVARSPEASSCPDTEALRSQIEGVLGRPAFSQGSEGGPPLGFDVEIFAQNQGFAATIRVTGSRQGQRALHDAGPGCAGLGEALALTLAMLLDDREPLDQPAPTPAPTPAPGPAPKRPEPPDRPATSLRAWLGGGVAAGLLSSVRPVLAGGADLSLAGPVRLGLGARWVPSERIRLGPGAVEVALLGLDARGCLRLLAGSRASLDGCALLAGGFFQATGVDYLENRSARPGWLAAGLGAQAAGTFAAPLGWVLRIDGLGSLREQRFLVRDVGLTPPLSRLSVTLHGGLSLAIW